MIRRPIRLIATLCTLSVWAIAAEPRAWWPFDEGRGDAGACIGAPDAPARVHAQWAEGAFGKAVFFAEEPAATVTIPDTPAVRFGTDSFSISVWICPTKLAVEPKGQYRRLLCKSSFPGTFWTLDLFDDGRVMFAMRDDQGHTGTTRTEEGLPEGAWTHLAVVVDRSAFTTRYFFNGVQVCERLFTKDFTGVLDVPGKDLLVSTWRKYIGLVDNLRIYGRALTAEDVAAETAAERERYSSPAFTATELEQPVFSVPAPKGNAQTMWDLEALGRVPATFPAPELEAEAEEGIRPLFFEGEPYKGNPTRVFAWYGVPLARTGPGPAMVLVHGGGGTAFKSWVRLWTDRGYAAIAMDTCGGIPVRPEDANKGWKRHEFSGPNGWGGFDNVDDPVHDQWTYHAVAAVVRAHTLLRSFPEVDADRVGLTGISWGGYLTNIVAGVDKRFVFASPVYGCGFLGENSAWVGRFRAMGQEKARRWLTLWDPGQYVCYAALPMLFCNGTNDHFYPMDSWQKTYRTAQGPVTLCCKVRMPHSHPPAGDPPEITAFADAHLRDGTPLIAVTAAGRNDRTAWAAYEGARTLQAAELVFTTDRGNWEKRVWKTAPADIDTETRRVTARIPGDATVFYINLIDEDRLIVSTRHEVLEE